MAEPEAAPEQEDAENDAPDNGTRRSRRRNPSRAKLEVEVPSVDPSVRGKRFARTVRKNGTERELQSRVEAPISKEVERIVAGDESDAEREEEARKRAAARSKAAAARSPFRDVDDSRLRSKRRLQKTKNGRLGLGNRRVYGNAKKQDSAFDRQWQSMFSPPKSRANPFAFDDEDDE